MSSAAGRFGRLSVALFLIGVPLVITPGPSAMAAGAGSWSSLASVPAHGQGVEGMSVAAVGSTIVAAYGFDASDTRRTRLYDTASDTWSLGTRAPGPRRSEGAAVAHGEWVYAIGGRSSGVIGDLDRYSVSDDAWVSLSSMPTPRAGLGAATVGGEIYAIGGRTSPSGPCSQDSNGQLDVVERYDIERDRWTTVAPLPTPRSDAAAAVIAGQIYVFGGCRVMPGGAIRFLDRVDVYDPRSDSWSARPADLPTARAAMYGVAARGGSVYVMGGWAGAGPLGVVEVYSVASDNYVPGAPMVTPRAEMGVTATRGRVYTVGGALPAFGESSDANEVFKP
jgi:Kelch motif